MFLGSDTKFPRTPGITGSEWPKLCSMSSTYPVSMSPSRQFRLSMHLVVPLMSSSIRVMEFPTLFLFTRDTQRPVPSSAWTSLVMTIIWPNSSKNVNALSKPPPGEKSPGISRRSCATSPMTSRRSSTSLTVHFPSRPVTSSWMESSLLSPTNGKSFQNLFAGAGLTPLPSFHAPEALFQPSMLGLEVHGIHEAVCAWSSILRFVETN